MAVSPAANRARRQNNVYELASYPGCFTPYSGTERHGVVVVVGMGSEHERLYPKRETKTAIAHAKSFTPSLGVDSFPFTQVCAEAIADLLADG